MLGIAALLLGGCDPISPPFMQNATTVPLDVTISYTNSAVTRDTWRPHMQVACGRRDAEITELVVRSGGRVIHRLAGAEIRRMMQSVPDPRKVVWQIQCHAISPVAVP